MAMLRAHFFYTTDAAGDFLEVSKRQVTKGSEFLRRNNAGLAIESYPKQSPGTMIAGLGPLSPNLRNDDGDIIPAVLKQYVTLRQQADAACPNPNPPRVPVIFLNFTGGLDAGQTVQKGPGQPWLPFILIDVKGANSDGLTLLHEMGHCVGLSHPGYRTRAEGVHDMIPAGEDDNFMGYGQFKTGHNGALKDRFHDRGMCMPWQFALIKTAYFHAS